jgi:chemotaxis methyl-accepting protein methylase
LQVPGPDPTEGLEQQLDQILALVADERGIDFRDYRREPILRGVRQRMDATGERTGAGYLARLRSDEGEVERLVAALVVPWSGFFRDPAVWSALAKVVLPRLLRQFAGRTLRAWCVGAATGEEAWTTAMLLAEACTHREGVTFELLASDLDRRTLELARAGRYAATAAADVPEAYRGRFLTAEHARVSVAPQLRQSVRFAYHDLLGRTLAPTEAVVASFELVLVRNVLIYFDRRLQQKALERIAGTLEPGAALVLGSVETMPLPMRDRFVAFAGVDPDLRVFSYVGA